MTTLAANQTGASSVAGLSQLDGIEPCLFPTFQSADGAEKGFGALNLLLDRAVELQQLLIEDQEQLCSLLRTAWALSLAAYTGLDNVCFGFQDHQSNAGNSGLRNGASHFAEAEVARFSLVETESVSTLVNREKQNKRILAGIQNQAVFDTYVLFRDGSKHAQTLADGVDSSKSESTKVAEVSQ